MLRKWLLFIVSQLIAAIAAVFLIEFCHLTLNIHHSFQRRN